MNRVINEDGLYGSICIGVARLEAALLAPFQKKGLGTAYLLTSRIFVKAPTCRAEIAPGAWMRLSSLEVYWGPVAVGGRPYEPEILSLLKRFASVLRGREWAFLDCGANFGYWSAIASSSEIGCPKVAAIELNPRTYEVLIDTAKLNGGFPTFNAAISDRSEDIVFVEDALLHAVSHVGTMGIPVATQTIDHIVQLLGWADLQGLVIKLDVEGYEVQALAGAISTRSAVPNHAVIYEDHGADTDCGNTRAFLENGYSVNFLSRRGVIAPIMRWNDAKAIKENPLTGYNFVATVPGTPLHSLVLPALPRS